MDLSKGRLTYLVLGVIHKSRGQILDIFDKRIPPYGQMWIYGEPPPPHMWATFIDMLGQELHSLSTWFMDDP